jgi:hypothetical protein
MSYSWVPVVNDGRRLIPYDGGVGGAIRSDPTTNYWSSLKRDQETGVRSGYVYDEVISNRIRNEIVLIDNISGNDHSIRIDQTGITSLP